jgi:beta-phosphoglucomutase
MKGVIFDLDGVLVSTDEFHYRGWARLATEEGIPFTREDNHRQRGVSRMESLEILLKKSPKSYSGEQKLEMATRKNAYYVECLQNLTLADTLPGAREILVALRAAGIKLAVGSSSRNTPLIMEKTDLCRYFDAVADGNDITRSKPDPEVFLLAARRLGLPPEECVVVEDAEAGVEAARRAGMRVVGVGPAELGPCDLRVRNIGELTADAQTLHAGVVTFSVGGSQPDPRSVALLSAMLLQPESINSVVLPEKDLSALGQRLDSGIIYLYS